MAILTAEVRLYPFVRHCGAQYLCFIPCSRTLDSCPKLDLSSLGQPGRCIYNICTVHYVLVQSLELSTAPCLWSMD